MKEKLKEIIKESFIDMGTDRNNDKSYQIKNIIKTIENIKDMNIYEAKFKIIVINTLKQKYI